MSNYRNRFDELYQFFGGYFHQDWSAEYDWKHESPNYQAVVKHFKALNPPQTILKVRNQIEDILGFEIDENELADALNNLGSNFYPIPLGITYRDWLEGIFSILDDSAEKGKVLREIE